MSQEQPPRPKASQEDEGIRYGDVFNVSGELASKNIAPRDAAAMQSADAMVFGRTQKGGPASVMQAAADFSERLGVVGHKEASDVTKDQGVTITEGISGGRRRVAEAVGGEVIGGYASARNAGAGGGGGQGQPGQVQGRSPSPAVVGDKITIGEALEAVAIGGGDKPVETSDAAAIQAAETIATGRGQVLPGGIGAEAQAAANLNPLTRDQDKTKLIEILGDAVEKLPDDKPVSREDADRVLAAEIRNNPRGAPQAGGVAAAVAAAARLNERIQTP